MPSHGFASPTIPGNTNWRQKASSTPAATAILRSSQELRRDTAITERSTSVLLALGSVAFAPEADVSAESVTEAIKKAKARGVHPISKDRSVIARLPLSGDVVAYLASEDYDPRDVRSLSRAEISGRGQAWTYLEILRELPGWEHAYLASTGPEFGARESRHINSVEQLTWQHVTEGRRSEDCVALGSWGVEWHDRETFESSFVYPPDCGTYDIPLGCLTRIMHDAEKFCGDSGGKRPIHVANRCSRDRIVANWSTLLLGLHGISPRAQGYGLRRRPEPV